MKPSKMTPRSRPAVVPTRRKATYSLPGPLLAELDRRTEGRARAKSGIVVEALSLYFARTGRLEQEAAFVEAARDPLFMTDNADVLRDFAALDAEVAKRKR